MAVLLQIHCFSKATLSHLVRGDNLLTETHTLMLLPAEPRGATDVTVRHQWDCKTDALPSAIFISQRQAIQKLLCFSHSEIFYSRWTFHAWLKSFWQTEPPMSWTEQPCQRHPWDNEK